MMSLPVANILEAVLNPVGRFSVLEGILALCDAQGEVVFSVSDGIVAVDVEWRGRRGRLLCPCRESHDGDQRFGQLQRLAQRLLYAPTPSLSTLTFHPAELYLFDSRSEGRRCDVALQQIPAGLPLDEYILRYAQQGDGGRVHRLLEGIAAIARELHETGIVHNNIKPSNMIVTPDGTPVLIPGATTRLADDEGEEGTAGPVDGTTGGEAPSAEAAADTDADNIALALIGTVTFLAACRPDLYLDLLRRGSFLLPAFRRRAPQLCRIARSHDLIPLYHLCNGLLQCRRRLEGRLALNILLDSLARATPEPLEEFSQVISPMHTPTAPPDTDNQMPICVQHGTKWRYVDADGAPAFEGSWDYAEDFAAGRAVVSLGDDFGVINPRGDVVLPVAFEEARWYPAEQLIIATYEGRSMLFDRMGVRIGNGEWEWLGDVEQGVIAAGRDGRYGYITPDGLTAIDFRFDNTYDFRDGVAIVEIDGVEKCIDLQGAIIG